MIKQAGRHLFQAYRNRAAAGGNHQRVILQVCNAACANELGRQCLLEHTLQATQARCVILKPGQHVAAAEKALYQGAHGLPVCVRDEIRGTFEHDKLAPLPH